MIEELDDVILTCDLPEHKLARGDIGTVVLVHREGERGESGSHLGICPWKLGCLSEPVRGSPLLFFNFRLQIRS